MDTVDRRSGSGKGIHTAEAMARIPEVEMTSLGVTEIQELRMYMRFLV